MVLLRRVIKNPVTGENITEELKREETAADMIMRGDPTWHRVDKPMVRKAEPKKEAKPVVKQVEMVDTANVETEKRKLSEMQMGEVIKLIKETEDGETLQKLSQDERPRVKTEAIKRAKALNIDIN
jgi:hypothetical protein